MARMISPEKILKSIRSALSPLSNVREKKMFGKLAFMVNDKLCIAVGDEEIMCRVDPTFNPLVIHKTYCKPVIMRGKEMKGYFYIKNRYLKSDEERKFWITLCLDYNKILT